MIEGASHIGDILVTHVRLTCIPLSRKASSVQQSRIYSLDRVLVQRNPQATKQYYYS